MTFEMNITNIKERIIAKEYNLKVNPNTRLKSVVWETMHLVIDQQNEIVEGFVGCIDCNLVLKQAKDGSTKNLLDHKTRCALTKNKPNQQTRISNILINIDQTMAI